MTKEQFEMLKKALSKDEIDIALLKEIIVRQVEESGSPSPMLQDLANALLSGNEDKIMEEAHIIRSFANYIPVMFVWDSRYYLELRS